MSGKTEPDPREGGYGGTEGLLGRHGYRSLERVLCEHAWWLVKTVVHGWEEVGGALG